MIVASRDSSEGLEKRAAKTVEGAVWASTISIAMITITTSQCQKANPASRPIPQRLSVKHEVNRASMTPMHGSSRTGALLNHRHPHNHPRGSSRPCSPVNLLQTQRPRTKKHSQRHTNVPAASRTCRSTSKPNTTIFTSHKTCRTNKLRHLVHRLSRSRHLADRARQRAAEEVVVEEAAGEGEVGLRLLQVGRKRVRNGWHLDRSNQVQVPARIMSTYSSC